MQASGINKGELGNRSVHRVKGQEKSFLLNSLAQVEKPVFNVGNTTDACTKGIWIYDTKKLLENGGRLIYFDSEGLASLDQDENYDAKIFFTVVAPEFIFYFEHHGCDRRGCY